MKTCWIALISLSFGLTGCVSLPEGDKPDGIALRLNNDGGFFENEGRRIDFMDDGSYREYRYSDEKEESLANIGNYQKAGGSITLLSDRPGARVETLFGVDHEGVSYWVGSENLSKISKPELSALRQSALREH